MLLRLFCGFAILFSFVGRANASEESLHPFVKFARESEVWIIPDPAHGNEAVLEEQLALMTAIKDADPRYNCLFLEVDRRVTPMFNAFFSGATYEEAFGAWMKEMKARMQSDFMNVMPAWYLERAHQMQFQVYGADVDWSSEEGERITEAVKIFRTEKDKAKRMEALELVSGRRNEIIGEYVLEHMRSGACKKSVLVIGDGHLAPTQNHPAIQMVIGREFKVFPPFFE